MGPAGWGTSALGGVRGHLGVLLLLSTHVMYAVVVLAPMALGAVGGPAAAAGIQRHAATGRTHT